MTSGSESPLSLRIYSTKLVRRSYSIVNTTTGMEKDTHKASLHCYIAPSLIAAVCVRVFHRSVSQE